MRTTTFYLTLVPLAAALQAQTPTIGNCSIFPANNVWNTPVDQLPVASNSQTYVNTIGATLGLKADFGSGTWNGGPIGIPYVNVPGTQTKYPATFLYAGESDPGPYAVPLNAPIEGGSSSTGDRHAIAVQNDACFLYELYNSFPQTSSWKADSGAIYDLGSNALRPAGWTSADAAGLPILAGLVRYEEVAAGEIRHAIRFTVPQTQRAYIWPARHYASSLTDPKYPPMGLRMRLKASYDIGAFPADVQVILRALKKYGMILADNGSAWFLSGAPDERWNNTNLALLRNVPGSAFEAVDESSLMVDPNSGEARQSGVSVAVQPSSATVETLADFQFTATVQNSTSQQVTWSVNGVTGGNSQSGYISATGLYSAPSAPPAATVLVEAASQDDPTAKGSANVTVRYPPPAISSASPNPVTAGSFTLAISGSGFRNGAAARLNGSALTTTFVDATRLDASGSTSTISSGLPLIVTNPDGQPSNSYSVAVAASGPVSVSVSPSTATVRVRRTQQFTALVQNAANTAVTWKVNGIAGGNPTYGTISAGGLYTAPNSPPTGAVPVTATSVEDPSQSAGASVTVVRR